ncbi:HAD domain-containing protein [Paraburkholderia sp. 35.1]|uniref:HAD domain-containing protein n=1 Tax=Paraburkholderia sp. 35.1 TaxID=2991058 RepID=UPI003D248F5F
MLLFLNFDGVLHPNAVQFDKKNGPVLDAPRHRLFESNDALAELVSDFTNLRLVLNTWWTYFLGFDESLRRLPKSLSSRVIGSILQHVSFCPNLPHRIALAADAVGNVAEPALILDHADARYPKHILRVTLLLEPQIGLADPRAVQALYRVVSRATEKETRLAENGSSRKGMPRGPS